MTQTGKLIVIDGADGAGKATQTKLLVDRLRAEGQLVETMSFPNYDANVFGQLIKECLQGKRGDFAALDARIASTLYAADRFESRPQLAAWLAAGKVVILDRYVSSNMLHQGSKMVGDEAGLRDFLAWNDRVEHEIFGMPRPDLIVYLDVPYEVRKNLMHHDGVRGELDEVEKDVEYQLAAEACAQELLASLNNWQRISCVAEGALLGREVIHEAVYNTVCAHSA
jgi:dTMP kinase